MKYNLIHITHYEYKEPVNIYHSLACLTPRTLPNQLCADFTIKITPKPTEIVARTDFFGNTVHYFSIHSLHTELTVLTTSQIDRFPLGNDLSLFATDMTCARAREECWTSTALKIQLLQFMLPSPYVFWDEEIKAFAKDCFPNNQSLFDSLKMLCHKLFTTIKYVPESTTINTPIKTVLREKKGVCQDISHLAIACIRSMGFAARYVSGYLETLPPPDKPKLQGSDASHAWISVYIPDLGWCDFDPTNDMIPQERHITTAWGRDYSDVPPLKGIIFSAGKHTLKVAVDVLSLE
ncbi:transglutaminase family protein [Xanthocytophaga flava]|uniref:transglutaminase family protein n=1 Tax=Xanthocytophaga flava TaxID=3048013 RepID=UPI0028D48996|nr:transglutaminase family protein [Xanthocytophaga flavus]MDJ1471549.1 transglutaminase family protein [Xanthocytophaga flavus]